MRRNPQHLHRAVVAVAEVRSGVSSRAPRPAGRRTDHRLLVRLLQRGASAFVPRREDAGRCLPQRRGGGVNGGSQHAPTVALVKQQRGAGEAWDLPMLRTSFRPRPSPRRRPGSPPAGRGSFWNLSLPCRGRTYGWSIHPERTHGEGSRGLSQPLGIHLNFALGLSNEVRPPQSALEVAPDVHVQRVFGRLGLVGPEASLEEVMCRARQLNPEWPGLLDWPVWNIGATYCHAAAPACDACPMSSVCPSAATLS